MEQKGKNLQSALYKTDYSYAYLEYCFVKPMFYGFAGEGAVRKGGIVLARGAYKNPPRNGGLEEKTN